MDVEQQRRGSTLIISIRGRFDAGVVEAVRPLWSADAQVRSVIIDLSRTTFLDSMGLATLVNGLKVTQQRGGRFVLVKPTDGVRLILDMTLMNTVFKIAPDLDAALALVDAP